MMEGGRRKETISEKEGRVQHTMPNVYIKTDCQLAAVM